jgi:hypothetical protein
MTLISIRLCAIAAMLVSVRPFLGAAITVTLPTGSVNDELTLPLPVADDTTIDATHWMSTAVKPNAIRIFKAAR